MSESKGGQIVSLAGTLGCVLIVITALVLVFAREQAWVIPATAGALAVMGIFFVFLHKK